MDLSAEKPFQQSGAEISCSNSLLERKRIATSCGRPALWEASFRHSLTSRQVRILFFSQLQVSKIPSLHCCRYSMTSGQVRVPFPQLLYVSLHSCRYRVTSVKIPFLWSCNICTLPLLNAHVLPSFQLFLIVSLNIVKS